MQTQPSIIFRAVNQRALQHGFPADIAAKIAANVDRETNNWFRENSIGGVVDVADTLKQESVHSFLKGGFLWSSSNEGSRYWCDLYDNLPNILAKT